MTNHQTPILNNQVREPPSATSPLSLTNAFPQIPLLPTMSTELGTLVVVVLKARNLPDKHSFYKQDVFAQITLQGETKKTKIEIKGGQHPVWDEELRFPVYDKGKSGMMMEVSCWSKEPRSNDLVGKGELDISETLRTGEFDGESLSLTASRRLLMKGSQTGSP